MLLASHIIVAVSIFFAAGICTTYALSVATGHVKVVWCFISSTGNFPVESCIFSAVLNICAALYFLIVLLRYCQVTAALEQAALETSKSMRLWNAVSLAFGLSGTVGLSITGCFQQRNLYFMHMLGVFCCTCGTNVYFLLQTYFSYTAMSPRTKRSVKLYRLVVVTLSTGVLLAGVVCALYFYASHPKRLGAVQPTTDGNTSSLMKAGTVLEWILFFLVQLFIYSFYPDFTKIALKANHLIFLD